MPDPVLGAASGIRRGSDGACAAGWASWTATVPFGSVGTASGTGLDGLVSNAAAAFPLGLSLPGRLPGATVLGATLGKKSFSMFGRGLGSVGSNGETLSGVTMTSSSVLDLVSDRLLKSAPRMGRCERPGTCG